MWLCENEANSIVKYVDHALLRSCVEHRPKFEKQMRSGLLDPFDVQLCRVTLLLAKAILSLSRAVGQLNPNLTWMMSVRLDLNLQAPGVPETNKALTA